MPIPVSVPWTALTGYPLIGNNLAASDDLQTLIVGGMEEGVYRSTNGGATWAQCDPANARLKNASQYISSPTSSPRPRRIGWAKLLARGFALDITRCRKCGGRMRVLEVVSDPDAIARILHGARAPLRLLLPASSCCSPDRVHPPAPHHFAPEARGRQPDARAPAAVLAAPLGLLAAHFVTRALPLPPWTVPKSSDRGLRRSPPDRGVLTLAPKFPHRTA
jgi:hypothetical protein